MNIYFHITKLGRAVASTCSGRPRRPSRRWWRRVQPRHTFGSGCGNPALDLAPILSARPTIGTTAQAALANIPSAVAFVALGWSRTAFGVSPLPLSLAGFGMPGCDLLQSAEAAAEPVTFTGTGSATFSLPLPNMTGLVGAQLYLQGWALAPGVNAGNTIVSNGVEWGIGNA